MSLPSHGTAPSNLDQAGLRLAWQNWLYTDQECITDQDERFCRRMLDCVTQPARCFMQSPTEPNNDAARTVIRSQISLAFMVNFLESLPVRDGVSQAQLDKINNSMTPETIMAGRYINTAYQMRFARQGRNAPTLPSLIRAGTLWYKITRRNGRFKGSFSDFHLPKTDLANPDTLNAYHDFLQHCQASGVPTQSRRRASPVPTHFGPGDQSGHPIILPGSETVNMASLVNPMPGPGESQFGLSADTNDDVLDMSMVEPHAGNNQSARNGDVESWEEEMTRLIASVPDQTARNGDPDEPGLNWDGGMEM